MGDDFAGEASGAGVGVVAALVGVTFVPSVGAALVVFFRDSAFWEAAVVGFDFAAGFVVKPRLCFGALTVFFVDVNGGRLACDRVCCLRGRAFEPWTECPPSLISARFFRSASIPRTRLGFG